MNSFRAICLRKIILEISCPVSERWIAELREMGVAAEFAENFDRVRYVEAESFACTREADPDAEEFSRETEANADAPGTLWITDAPERAQSHLACGEPVLALIHEGNHGIFFQGVKYVCEDLEETDAEYLDKVYRRYADIPWNILETERCFLRETTVEDVDAFYGIYREPSVTAYMGTLFEDREDEIAYTRNYIRNIYEFYGFGVWTVCLKETGEVIGRAGLSYREGFEDPELGFLIGVPWQGRGLAREVCGAVMDFGRRELELRAVNAFVRRGNGASVRLLEELGFSEAGEELLEGIRHIRFLWREDGPPAKEPEVSQ